MLSTEFKPLLDRLVQDESEISKDYLEIILYRLDGVMYHRTIDTFLVKALIAGEPYKKEIWDTPSSIVNAPGVNKKYRNLLRSIVEICDELKSKNIDFTRTAIYQNCVIAENPRLW